jgi:hypothetical protein
VWRFPNESFRHYSKPLFVKHDLPDAVAALGVAGKVRTAVSGGPARAVDAGALQRHFMLAYLFGRYFRQRPYRRDGNLKEFGTYASLKVDVLLGSRGGDSEAGQGKGDDAEELHGDWWMVVRKRE